MRGHSTKVSTPNYTLPLPTPNTILHKTFPKTPPPNPLTTPPIQMLQEIITQLQQHLDTEIKEYNGISIKAQSGRITCDDGFSMSVQASKLHYCKPQETEAHTIA